VKALVLDVSSTLAFLLKDEFSTAAIHVLTGFVRGSEKYLLVPGHFWIELTNGLLMAERRSRASRKEIAEALDFIFALSINTDDETNRRCSSESLSLAREHDLTLYDAAYLELAIRRQADLATLDKALVRAAKSVGIQVIA
jgi:predicted nucleic acid-binding protein